MKSLLTLISVGFSLQAWAYSFNYINEDTYVGWASPNQSLYINTSGSIDVGDEDALAIIEQSLSDWNSKSPRVSLKGVSTTQAPRDSRNDLYFTQDSIYLGPGVVGVTVTTHDQSTGELLEADVIINSEYSFNTNPYSQYYLGNVVTHELGHLLGLGHSQQHYASMYFTLRKGQHTPHSDDTAGLMALYRYDTPALGSISGTVIGGAQMTGIFGAHVSAISLNNGTIVASSIANSKGEFRIEGLPVNDQYHIYVAPLLGLSHYASFYQDVKSDFCNSGFAYRGSFYQSCLSADEGFPYAVELTSVSRNKTIGPVTIRCSLDVPVDYMAAKENEVFELRSTYLEIAPMSFGDSFVGFFTVSDASEQKTDHVRLDLSAFDLYQLYGSRDLYLEVQFIVDEFMTPLSLTSSVERVNGESFTLPTSLETSSEGVVYDQEGNPRTTLVGRYPLSLVDPTENIYELVIKPTLLDDFVLGKSIVFEDVLPAYEDYGDELLFYLMTAKLVERTAGGVYTTLATKSYGAARDNLSCLDGGQSYDVRAPDALANTGAETTSRRGKRSGQDGGVAGCGAIDLGGPGQGGGGGALMALIFISMVFIQLRKKGLVS